MNLEEIELSDIYFLEEKLYGGVELITFSFNVTLIESDPYPMIYKYMKFTNTNEIHQFIEHTTKDRNCPICEKYGNNYGEKDIKLFCGQLGKIKEELLIELMNHESLRFQILQTKNKILEELKLK